MGNICLSRSPGQKYVKGNGQEMRSSPRRRRKAAEIEAPAPASLKAAANDDETKKSDDEDEDEDEDEASSVESAPTSPPRDLRLNLQHISEREGTRRAFELLFFVSSPSLLRERRRATPTRAW